MEPSTPPGPEFNEAARYAMLLNQAGKSLDLGPSISKGPAGFHLAKEETDEDVLKYYEEDMTQGIDLSRPDWEEHWNAITRAYGKRTTDYGQLLADAGGEIAAIPGNLVEGIAEGGLVKGVASTGEGVVRSLRDLWGMVAESENPTSLMFGFKSVIKALMNGKPGPNPYEEAQQWNQARKFNLHSMRMMQGDESVLEQYIDMDEDTAKKVRSFINPKVAHAMSFIGMELPSIIAAPFTGGASAELAVSAAGSRAAQAAKMANKASLFNKVGTTLASAAERFDNFAQKVTQRTVGGVAYGLGKALEIPANIAGAAVGGTIDNLASRTGFSSGYLRNAAEVAATDATVALGGVAGGTRQTVGFLGSMGLRTTSELLQEIGNKAMMRSLGVIEAGTPTSLTVLESVAANPLLSPSAKVAAKMLNTVVDPVIQLSTASLKHAYKDALTFSFLGYLTDKERGAVGGAAQGMMWGGYSGALRHGWSLVNGGLSHDIHVKNFDENYLPQIEKVNPKFATLVREVSGFADSTKSTRVMSQVRSVAQILWQSLDSADRKNIITHVGNRASLEALLISEGVDASQLGKFSMANEAGGSFTLVKKGKEGMVPVLFLNREKHKFQDFGHEVLGHVISYSLREKGKLGEHLRRFFGDKADGGLFTDEIIASRAARRRSLEMAVEETSKRLSENDPNFVTEVNKRAKEIYEGINTSREGSKAFYMRELEELRQRANGAFGSAAFWTSTAPDAEGKMTPAAYLVGNADSVKFMFEEGVAGYAESLFIHTNLQNLILPDELKPFRINIERIYNERFARKLTDLEMAGVRAKYGDFAIDDPNNKGLHGKLTIQAEAYDDGVWRRAPEFDQLIQSMVRDATSHDAQAVNRLSPAQQLAEAKLHKKEFLFNMSKAGATMKGTKELNDMSTKAATDAFEVFKNLDESLRPEIALDEHGNQSVDMMRIRDEALDAMQAAGAIDPETARSVKVIRDAYTRWESTGFATSNIFTGTYWGDSQRTVKNGFFQRLFGNDVSVTHRVFVPFEMKLTLKTTDAAGKQLRVPRGGMLMTVVDYMAIHRRKMKLWSRPDVRNIFVSLETYNNAFDEYLINMMKDAGSRVPSAELFNKRFPGQGEKVRDILYETFGGSIRKDESYINAPREGYSSSHENPNYPIHSMRMELLVGLELTTGKPMPYHHGRSYEGLRRNYSLAGFERVNMSDSRFVNGQGYEIIKTGAKWKVFSPFGGIVGMFTDFAKAAIGVEKDLAKRDLADLMPKPTEMEWADMTRTQKLQYMSEVGRITHQTYTQRMLESRGKGMMSLVSLDPNSDVTWTPKYKDTYSEIVKSFAKRVATLRDILTEDNVKELNRWNDSNNAELFDPSAVPIIRVEKKNNTFGPSFEDNGRFFSIQRDGNTKAMSILIDFDHIEKYGVNEDAKSKMLAYAIESSIEAMSMSLSKYGENMSYWLPTYNFVALIDTPDSINQHYVIAETLKATRDEEKFRKQRSEEVSKIQADIKTMLKDRDKDPYAAGEGTGLILGESPEAKSLLESCVSGSDFAKKFSKDVKANTRVEQIIRGLASARSLGMKEFDKHFHVIKEGLLAVMGYVDTALNDESVWIPYPSEKGGFNYALVFRDVSGAMKIDDAIKAINSINEVKYERLKKNLSEGVLLSLDQSVHSIVQKVGKGSAPKDIVTGVANSKSEYISARYTIEQLRIANGSPMAIYNDRGVTMVVSSKGLVATAKPGSEATRSGVYGNTESGSAFPQPENVRMNSGNSPYGALVTSLLLPDSKKLTYKDVDGGLHFRILDAAIMSLNPELEPALSKFAGIFEQSQGTPKDRLSYAESLYQEVVNSGDKNLIGIAQGVYSIELARNPDARLQKLAPRPELENALKTRFMDEAIANWTLEMQRYWAIGEDAPINKGFNTILERKYYAEHGASPAQMKRAQGLIKAIGEAHRPQVATYESLRNKPKTMNSLADASGLSKEHKEELGKLGLLKKVTIKGVETEIFELSDSDSYVDYSSSGGEPHLLAFADSADSQKAFSDYQQEVNYRMTTPGVEIFMPRDKVLGKTKLGKVFGHPLLYKYFPWMKDIDVNFIDIHGAQAGRRSDGSFVINIGARALASEKLNLPDGLNKFEIDSDSLRSKYSGSNYITGLFVHEIQHILQRSGNILSEDRSIQGIRPVEVSAAFHRLLGIKTDPQISYYDMKFGQGAAKVIQNFVDNPDAPVIASLRLHAKPLMKSAMRNMMEFMTFEHTAGRVSDEMYRRAESLSMAAARINTIDDAYKVYKEFDAFKESVADENPRFVAALSDNKEFRAAFHALGLVSNYDDVIKGHPSGRAVALQKALTQYSRLEYVLEPVERQAFTSQQRRGLTQAELAVKDRLLAENSSVLEIIDSSMNKAGIRARELGGSTLMNSIAGIGAAAEDNPAAQRFGFMSVVRFFMGKAHDELKELGRFVISQEGWEIDDNGRLVLTSAKYVVKGDYEKTKNALIDKNRAQFDDVANYGDPNSQFLGMPEAGKNRTYTIRDFAALAGFVIESEDVLSVGNGVIDIINSDRFPPMVLGGEIRSELVKLGIFTEEAAKAVMLDSVDARMKDMVLTKNDLLNILTFNHITLSRSAVTSGIGAVPDMRNRSISANDFRKIYRAIGVDESNVHSAMTVGMGETYPARGKASELEIGRFKWVANKVTFQLQRPSWCPDNVWQDFRKRFDESKFIQKIPKVLVSSDAVGALNARLRRAALLIGPVVEAAAARIEKLANEDKVLSKKLYAVLLSDLENATLRISVGAETGIVHMRDDTLSETGFHYETNEGTTSTLISRYGLQAGNESVYGYRGGQRATTEISFAPTMLGALFGPYIHHNSEAPSLASADVSEVIRPGANINPEIATSAINNGLDNGYESAAYYDVGTSLQEELLVIPNKLSRDGTFSDIKRAFDQSAQDTNNHIHGLKAVLSDVMYAIVNEDISEVDFDDLSRHLEDVGDDRFGGHSVQQLRGMNLTERLPILEPIRIDLEDRIQQLNANLALSSKIYEVWEDALLAADTADQSVIGKRVSNVFSGELKNFIATDKAKQRGISLTGVFGMVAPDGKAIITLDADNADITGISSFPISTTGRGIPIETVLLYNRSFHNLENSVNHALFSMLRPKAFKLSDAHANPERFKASLEQAVGGFDRAEVLVEYLEKYAPSEKTSAVSLGNGALAYYLGGNVLAVQSTVGLMMLENPDRAQGNSAFMQAQLGRIMSLLGQENERMTKPVISSNKSTIFSSESAVHVTNATLGAVAMPVLWGKLKTGIPSVTPDGKVVLTHFGVFDGMLSSVNRLIESGASKEEIALVAKDWIRGIDKSGVSMMAHELSSQMASSAVLTQLGLIAGVDYAKNAQPPANYGYSVKGALNFGAAFGLDHVMGQHSALSGKIDQMGTGFLATELSRMMESAMMEESGEFWIGMAVAMHAHRDKRSKSYPLAYSGKYNSRPFQARNIRIQDSALMSDAGSHPEFFVPMYGARLSSYRHNPSITPGLSNPSWEGVATYLDTAYGPSPSMKYNADTPRIDWNTFGQDGALSLAQERSPEPLIDSLESTTVMDAISQAQAAGWEHISHNDMFAMDSDGEVRLKVNDSSGGGYTETDYIVGSQGSGAIAVPSTGTVVKSAIKRSLIANRLAAVAKQLGKTEVSSPAARFNLTVSPSPSMMAIKASENRRQAWVAKQAYISKVMGRAGGTGFTAQLHQKDYGKIGLSWKRLEDGRIMVNFSPDVAMTATYDVIHDSDIQSPAVGIPLIRAVGWDVNSGTAFSQSLARRAVFGVGKALGAYAKEQAMFLNNGKKFGGFDDVAVRDYLRGMQKLMNGEIYLGGRTHNKLVGGASLRQRNILEVGAKTRENILRIIEGNIPQSPEDALRIAAYADEVMHDVSQDFAYFTFILPADAKIEDFNTAILNHYAAAMTPSGPYSKTRGAPIQFGIDGPMLSTHIDRLTQFDDERNSHLKMMLTMREGIEDEASISPALQLRGMQATSATSEGNIVSLMESAAKSIQTINPNFHGDLMAAFHRIMAGESGYYLPDSERSLALYGEKSAAIELMFPGRTDLKHYSWDSSEALNLTVFKNSQKRWTIGWNEFGPVGTDGKRQVKRMVRNFESESDANNFADKISAGNIQAEIAKATPNRDSIRMEMSGNAKGLSAQVQRSHRIHMDASERGGEVYRESKWGVGNLGKVFDTAEAAKAAANLLRRGDVLSMEAPKQERISLSVADHSQSELEQILRHRSTFAIGGSPVQFVSKMINAIIKGMDKNKRVKDVRTGLEWFDLLSANTVSKNELRATGMAEFLYANRKNNLTKKELFDFLYVFYPLQGRMTYQSRYEKISGGDNAIRNPHNVDFVASRMLYANRTLKMVSNIFGGLDEALTKANDEAVPAMETAIQAVKDMHMAAMVDAYEKVINKDVMIQLVNDLGLSGKDGRVVVSTILDELRKNPERVMQFSAPLLETYRLNVNSSMQKAKAESLAALTGVQLEMGDPLMMSSTEMTQNNIALSDWDSAIEEYYDIERSTQSRYGYHKGGDHGYSGYTSGLGEHVYTALFTYVVPDKAEYDAYIEKLTASRDAATDPAEKTKFQSAIDSAKHIYLIRENIRQNYARTATSHKGAPSGSGTNLLGHLRVTDATVPTAIPVLSTPGTIFEQLKSYGEGRGEDAQIPVSFIEELQSDTYQRKTFGPSGEDFDLYATFKEIEELPGIRKEFTELSDKIAAMKVSENAKFNFIMNANGGSPARYVVSNYISGAYAEYQIRQSGPFIRYMLSQMGDGVWKESGKVIPVPNNLQIKYGLPATIPDIYPEGTLSSTTLSRFRQSFAHPLDSLNAEVLKNFLMPNGTSIPGFGSLKFGHLVQNGSQNNLSGLAKLFLAMSPEFIGVARELADAVASDPAAVENLKGRIDFDAVAKDWAEKVRRIAQDTRIRDAFLQQFGNEAINRTHFNRMVQLANILTEFATIEADEAAFPVRRDKLNSSESQPTRTVDIDPESSDFDKKFVDRKQVFCVNTNEKAVEFVNRVGLGLGLIKLTEEDIKQTLAKYKMHRMKTIKSPRGILATTLAFTAEALNTTQEKVATEFLAGRPAAGITASDLIDFAHGRTKLNDNPNVLIWVNEMLDYGNSTRNEFALRFGTLFRASDYEHDPSNMHISSMHDHIQHNARTMMGKMMEAMAGPMAVLWASFNTSDDTAVMKARQAELAKKAGFKLDEDGDIVRYSLPDSIPHGEDNAYRPILVNAYVMNALAKRQRALVIADARHHRERYASVGYVNYAVNFGNGRMFMITNPDGDMSASAYILNVVRKRGLYNKLIDRIRAENLGFEHQVEIDGTSKKLGVWLIEAGHSVIDEMPDAFNSGDTRDSRKREFARAIEQIARLYNQRAGSQESMAETFRNVSDSDDMVKRMGKMKDAPEGLIVSLPYDKTHGYAVNYGAPGWLNEYYYAGNPQKAIEAVSHDAFEKASVAMANDKTYVVLAPNGKVLFEKIATLEEAEERAAQSSRYLGNVPHLTVFLKQYGRVGAYVMEAFMQATMAGERHPALKMMKEGDRAPQAGYSMEGIIAGSGLGSFAKSEWNAGKYDEAYLGPHSVDDNPSSKLHESAALLAKERNRHANAIGPASISSGGITGRSQIPLQMHAMGITRLSSHEEIAAGMVRIAGFTGPMMVIKPKFPTASHASEMAKLIVEGVGLMSLGDMSKQGKVRAMTEAFNWYRTPKRREDDESRPIR